MLTHLAIRNLALIDTLELEPQSGFTALTGETGAGKSMLIDALALATGGRAEAGQIRAGETVCEVAATFQPAANTALTAVLEEQGLDTGDTLLLRRQLKLDNGKLASRAWVNGTPVAVATLAALGEHLLDIHGQHGTLELTTAAAQRQVLDAFAQATTEARSVSQTHAAWQAAMQARQEAEAALARASADADLNAAWMSELEALNYQDGEEHTLATTRSRLMNLEAIRHHLATADAALNDEQGALNALGGAARAITSAAQVDDTLVSLSDRLAATLEELRDIAHETARSSNGLDGEGQSLEQIDDRLHALKAAARKHQAEVAGLPAVLARLQGAATAQADGADHLVALNAAETTARTAFEDACMALSAKRQAALESLHQQLHGKLADLLMPHARCAMQLTPLEQAGWNAHGAETVTLLLAANPGQPLQPLAKVASGGEVSRLMLALKQVFAAALPPHTMVLDEIDSGLSGAAAHAVGKAMQAIAATHQLVGITHHAQVAAQAAHHWQVSKHTEGTTTRTTVSVLEGPARETELARLISGATITDTARAAARELLAA
ncbi:MAG: DNA repair protein RecN [Pseudomonadaceae bacterium]|nr:DNA repair protein RecN [Pseudomonadaceae bacterium]